MFPVFDKKGWTIAFGGRAICKDVNPKYLNSPESEIFQKREVLYGCNLAVKNVTKDKPFVIVEGYMDVVMMHKFGFGTAVASMGTAFSSQHLLKIWKYCDEPVMCLDGDKAGHNAMIKAAFLAMPYLQPGKSLRFCAIPGDDDPDSFLRSHPKSDMEKLLTESETLIDFLWRHFANEFNSMPNKTPENIANWKKQIYEHLNEIQHADIKALYKQEIKEHIYETLHIASPRKSRRTADNQFSLKSSHDATAFPLQVNKNEKTLLREAVLLCILTMRPSIISAVAEELVSIEFSQKNFGTLRDYMVSETDCPAGDDVAFIETLQNIHRMADGYCRCVDATDEEVETFWRSVFEFGVSRKLAVCDFKVAKSECANSLDEARWDRLKALKLELLNKKD
jgi:DNA primase